jgi:hypothetical protein
MNYYRVSLFEEEGDRFLLLFDCQADDQDHAIEQAEDAYHGCVVSLVTQIDGDMYMVPPKVYTNPL